MTINSRHKGREAALQIMYQAEQQEDLAPDLLINDYFKHFALSTEGQDFASDLVKQTLLDLKKIDKQIESHSDKWRLSRMSKIDRNILRLATHELCFAKEKTPEKVVLNEWIEVAKRFSTEHSGSFINGILDSML